ncbi:MAG: alanine racemase, partial [Oscillospiraceae bacterium]|nr:alanine racemase [Oscillospiraceae bacterium]
TGMTRLGFFAYGEDNELSEAEQVANLQHLHIEGIFTHFCAADSLAESDVLYTRGQFERYIQALATLEAAGIRPEYRHCANSGAALLHPEYALDMARCGIALYGLLPSADAAGTVGLKPVMSLHTSVAQIRDIPAGTEISYGRTFCADKPMRIAVLPIGYADGLPRSLSSNASFRLNGKDVPIIGRICMDMCMVDVTDADAAQGDTLTLFGYDEHGAHVPCEALAEKADTIGYELVCAVSKRIPRIYIEGGKQSEILQYIV